MPLIFAYRYRFTIILYAFELIILGYKNALEKLYNFIKLTANKPIKQKREENEIREKLHHGKTPNLNCR